MQEIVDLELQFRDSYIFATELVLQFDQLIFEFNPKLAFIVQIVLILLLCFFELLSLVLEHELDLSEMMVFVVVDLIGKKVPLLE